MTPIDPRELRNAFGQFGTGVTIITTHCEGRDHGMTANASMSVSLAPPLVAVSIAKSAKMLCNIQNADRFAVSDLLQRDRPSVLGHLERRHDKLVFAGESQ